MCQHVCSDSLKLIKPREKGYLVISLFSCATGLCWAGGTAGLIQHGHAYVFVQAYSQSSKECGETRFSFAEAVLIKVSHITIFQVFYYSLSYSCFGHLHCADVMLTSLNIG